MCPNVPLAWFGGEIQYLRLTVFINALQSDVKMAVSKVIMRTTLINRWQVRLFGLGF